MGKSARGTVHELRPCPHARTDNCESVTTQGSGGGTSDSDDSEDKLQEAMTVGRQRHMSMLLWSIWEVSE